MTMIGRNVVSAAFDFDLKSPRQSARNPATEFAPPTSTPNSVRCTGSLGAADSEPSPSTTLSSSATEATTSGKGAAVIVFAGLSGSVDFAGAGSVAVVIDFVVTTGAVGTAGVFEAGGALVDIPDAVGVAGGAGIAALAAATGVFAITAELAAAGAFEFFCATDAITAAAGSGPAVPGFSASFGAVVATGETAGERAVPGAGDCETGCDISSVATAGAGVGSVATGIAAVTAAFCFAIAPVTESSPCSSALIREYSLSRSPLSVSMADANRRVSFWLSLATA
jgi:hypothetical protein